MHAIGVHHKSKDFCIFVFIILVKIKDIIDLSDYDESKNLQRVLVLFLMLKEVLSSIFIEWVLILFLMLKKVLMSNENKSDSDIDSQTCNVENVSN